MTLVLGLAIIVAAAYAIYRQIDVRLVLLVAALALGSLAGNPAAIVRTFLETFSDEKFVVPICTAMGFAYVLRHTECDQHLVQLLVKPVRRGVLLFVLLLVIEYLVVPELVGASILEHRQPFHQIERVRRNERVVRGFVAKPVGEQGPLLFG